MAYRIAIVQSSYIPWRGYFSIIAQCDLFVFLDSVQFTRRDWRTRNRIKTPNGPLWLSVPVRQKGNYIASIDSIEIADPDWARKHLRSLETNYRRAPFFASIFPLVEEAYAQAGNESLLSAVNRGLTARICEILDVKTPLVRDIDLIERARLDELNPTARLLELATSARANEYLSGPSAQSYMDVAEFAARGVSVIWMDYSGLPEYAQLWGGFDPALSILDALFNVGPESVRSVLGRHPS